MDLLLDSVLTNSPPAKANSCAGGNEGPKNQKDRGKSLLWQGNSRESATQKMKNLQEVAHEATGHEKTMQRRLQVLQVHNEKLALQTEDLVKTVNMYQSGNRQLEEELAKRDAWIRETIQQLDCVDGAITSKEQREGLRRWLQKEANEAAQRKLGTPTLLDVRKAQAHADEMGIREREVRSRLVFEAQKSQAAEQMASVTQVALQDSNHRVALTEAEISLLRQQLHQALLNNQQISGDLTQSRVEARSAESQICVLEGKLTEALAQGRDHEEELHSLHADYNHRLRQLEGLRQEKVSLESQVHRVCSGFKHVVDELRSPSPDKTAHRQGERERGGRVERERERARESEMRRSKSSRKRMQAVRSGQNSSSNLLLSRLLGLKDERRQVMGSSGRERDDTSNEGSDSSSDAMVKERRGGREDDENGVFWSAQQANEEDKRHGEGSRRDGYRDRDRVETRVRRRDGETSRSPFSYSLDTIHISPQHQVTAGKSLQAPSPKGEEDEQGVGRAVRAVDDAEEWLEMDDFDMQDFEFSASKPHVESRAHSSLLWNENTPPHKHTHTHTHTAEGGIGSEQEGSGDGLVLGMLGRSVLDAGVGVGMSVGKDLAATMLAPVGSHGPWRNPGLLWHVASSVPIDLAELHANGKEISGFALRRALKALGKGSSIALSAVDTQVCTCFPSAYVSMRIRVSALVYIFMYVYICTYILIHKCMHIYT